MGEDDYQDKANSIRGLLVQYKENEAIRDGIDLAFIALTGYSIGTLIEQVLN